jgi:hypothetical protein
MTLTFFEVFVDTKPCDVWEKILGSCIIKEYLIKWKNLQEEDVAWESEQFHQLHPSLPLL